jgi:hypothetical protein
LPVNSDVYRVAIAPLLNGLYHELINDTPALIAHHKKNGL